MSLNQSEKKNCYEFSGQYARKKWNGYFKLIFIVGKNSYLLNSFGSVK